MDKNLVPMGDYSAKEAYLMGAYGGHGISAEMLKPFSHDVFLMNTPVNGLPYVRGIRKLLKQIKKGDEIKLVREPDNEHDELAILVKNQDGMKLGYVPRRCNEVMARLMDAGKLLHATVSSVKVNEKTEQNDFYELQLYIEIFMTD